MKNNSEALGNTDYAKLGQMIAEIKVAMMTTVGRDGELESRPMQVQELDESGSLWFFTSTETEKTRSIADDQRINLAYASPKDSKYVSVGGIARLVDDRAKAAELWNPAMKAFFPKGLNEADLILIKVQVDTAEYWDAPAGKMVQLLKMAKAAITGQHFEASKGEHGRVDLH